MYTPPNLITLPSNCTLDAAQEIEVTLLIGSDMSGRPTSLRKEKVFER